MSTDMETNLATELLHEVKKSAQRWFIIAMAELVAIVALIILLFCIPYSTTEEISYDQNIDGIENSDGISQRIGDIYGESEADSY